MMKRLQNSMFYFLLIITGFVLVNVKCIPGDAHVYHPEKEAAFQKKEITLPLTVQTDAGLRELELERYVTGVVLAEMSADFEMEALKSQAVAARTFAWKAFLSGGRHDKSAVCTRPSCCQGYLSEEAYLYKTNSPQKLQKIQQAVTETQGVILTYNGEPIEAVFFSCSGGITEDAMEVWGCSYPYLTSKESPGEEDAYCFTDERKYTRKELEHLFGVVLNEQPESWFQEWEFTSGKGVATVEIGGKRFSGTKVRQLLNLRSTYFVVSIEDETAVFHTRGYGHRVGMSQFGANAMAAAGKMYPDILEYYYNGAELTTIS